MKKFFMILLLGVGVSACSTLDKGIAGSSGSMPDEDQRRELAQNMQASEDQKAQFIAGKPWLGMTEGQLQSLMGGEPSKRQTKLTEKGNQEVQLYSVRIGNWKTGVRSHYYRAILTGGLLTEFQEIDNRVGSFDKL
jgi:hypothetical protein